jgi:hypothetical protein
MPWSRAFDDPIPLPRGRQLVTLEDAATYIMKLPKAEQDLPEWQAAACLIGTAEGRRGITRPTDVPLLLGAARRCCLDSEEGASA